MKFKIALITTILAAMVCFSGSQVLGHAHSGHSHGSATSSAAKAKAKCKKLKGSARAKCNKAYIKKYKGHSSGHSSIQSNGYFNIG